MKEAVMRNIAGYEEKLETIHIIAGSIPQPLRE